ncbi:MAG: alanine--tRNA ligase [Patescibacteria group bacterium]|nr:alanine--tRNA ligase [Patescibacteria group bacterium]MDD5164552.1 alanine--tRNA ligase [Patescibacteria group bacterium]MDD5534323.1 alanine--tRNA ligase [Patescibacteria group bacterium]
MNSKEIREKYLKFFEEKGHTIISSASLIPENDPTALFISAGMQPLVPYLMGEKHPEGKRLVDIQLCVRTDDIDEVGDETHHAFFEMLGNWSLGDYFKEEAIKFSFEFLTKKEWLGLEKEKLAISIFEGDEDAPKDEESKKVWLSLNIPETRIKELPKKNNWWGPAGETGPCGPDTEMFYWVGKEVAPKEFNPDDKRWVEIWNDVFMQYFKQIRLEKKEEYDNLILNNKEIPENFYEFIPLKQKNVDTGMGLERTLAIINGFDDNYKTDVFGPIIQKIEELSGKKYEDNKKEFRIIADHLKAATFIIGDKNGVEPSNQKQGYVVRRLIRLAIGCGQRLGIKDIFCFKIAEEVIKIYQDVYPDLNKNKDLIINQLVNEEKKFGKSEERGISVATGAAQSIREIYSPTGAPGPTNGPNNKISGKVAFNWRQTYGLSIDRIREIAKKEGLELDEEGLNEEIKKHQELSRTASAGMFKGGLADSGEQTTKLHTAAHLMLAALRQVLGDHVFQKGSNITAERLRFDFSHSQKMTPEEIKKVEEIVNQKIKENLPVICEEMTLNEAKEKGAMGVFESKYGEKVKVYSINNFSKEICGGPHAKNTQELGSFKIIKEEASSAGVRRIKAVIE